MNRTDRQSPLSEFKEGSATIGFYKHQQGIKKYLMMVAVLFLLAATGCKKEQINAEPIPGQETPGKNAGLLEQIIQEKIPSPAYHFFYGRNEKINRIELSSGLFTYDVLYDGNRVSRMENKKSQSGLKYIYQNEQVSCIQKYKGENETVASAYYLNYIFDSRLKHINYFVYNHGNTDSTLSRTFTFHYHSDGNLAGMEEKRLSDNGSLIQVKEILYGEYDEGKNMEGAGLLREFSDDLLFLPDLSMQKNNPAIVKITTGLQKFSIRNHFQYQGKHPALKISKMTQTAGEGMGNTVTFTVRYTYY